MAEFKIEDARLLCQQFLDNKVKVDEEKLLSVLEQVDAFPMDIETLKETKIGALFSKLSAQKMNIQVGTRANEILSKWKRDLRQPSASLMSENKNNNNNNNSQSPLSSPLSSQSSQNFELNLKRKLEEKNDDSDNISNKARKVEGEEVKKIEILVNNNNNDDEEIIKEETQIFTGTLPEYPQRNTFQVRFWEALKQEKKSYVETVEMAIQIENELFLEYGKKQKEFPQKFRTLFTNLKDPLNVDLRKALFEGLIFPSELVTFSHEDLANPELKKDRKKIVDYATEALQGVKPSTSKLFTCGRCKKNETSYYQMQTRSADEPMTTFISCINCGHHWKQC